VGLKQRNWARKVRALLVQALGGVCIRCGSKGGKKNGLELDCIAPRGDRHHRQEWSARMSFYRHEFKLNNLQLLCKKCHGKKSIGEWGSSRVIE
jgi:5-methylcytosine-specific restriction endonuclease McrA